MNSLSLPLVTLLLTVQTSRKVNSELAKNKQSPAKWSRYVPLVTQKTAEIDR